MSKELERDWELELDWDEEALEEAETEAFASPSPQDALTVSELTSYIKGLLDGDELLADVWVRGELSNCRQYQSGHLYFTLKDEKSQLRCVMWKERVGYLNFRPKDGDRVRARGNITVYPRDGRYQLYAWKLEFDGIGALWEAFERLKKKLEAEGLFDKARKKPIPPFPKRIGIVTSPDGAAVRDIIRIARRRHPGVELVLIPTLVQGAEAPDSIANAISLANAVGGFEVLIVGRGGGSLEDLWAFNEEVVARAAAASKIPIVSAVGHETDFTILDFVADLRAPTPSAAAQMVVPDLMERHRHLRQVKAALANALWAKLSLLAERVRALTSRRVLRHPQELLNVRRQAVDELRQSLVHGIQRRLWEGRRRFERAKAGLEALSPLAVLERGYAIVLEHESKRLIARTASAKEGAQADVVLWDGMLECRIEKVIAKENAP